MKVDYFFLMLLASSSITVSYECCGGVDTAPSEPAISVSVASGEQKAFDAVLTKLLKEYERRGGGTILRQYAHRAKILFEKILQQEPLSPGFLPLIYFFLDHCEEETIRPHHVRELRSILDNILENGNPTQSERMLVTNLLIVFQENYAAPYSTFGAVVDFFFRKHLVATLAGTAATALVGIGIWKLTRPPSDDDDDDNDDGDSGDSGNTNTGRKKKKKSKPLSVHEFVVTVDGKSTKYEGRIASLVQKNPGTGKDQKGSSCHTHAATRASMIKKGNSDGSEEIENRAGIMQAAATLQNNEVKLDITQNAKAIAQFDELKRKLSDGIHSTEENLHSVIVALKDRVDRTQKILDLKRLPKATDESQIRSQDGNFIMKLIWTQDSLANLRGETPSDGTGDYENYPLAQDVALVEAPKEAVVGMQSGRYSPLGRDVHLYRQIQRFRGGNQQIVMLQTSDTGNVHDIQSGFHWITVVLTPKQRDDGRLYADVESYDSLSENGIGEKVDREDLKSYTYFSALNALTYAYAEAPLPEKD